jgi:tetratricopeptide (TPR) repeat protein
MLVLLAALLAVTPCPAPGSTSPAQACGEETDAEALIQRASALMDAEAWDEALALLRLPAAQELGDATKLLEGICLYERGEDDEARKRLEAARADAELAPSAELFLGLLAQRRGLAAEAAEAFAQVASRDRGELGQAAGALLKHSRREGRLSLTLALGAGYDSNPLLAPPGGPRPVVAADAAAQGSASLALSPWGAKGPYARARVQGRRQARLRGFDLAGAQAGAGWQVTHGRLRLGADYGWEGLLLGGAPFLNGHQGAAAVGWRPGATSLEASYSARRDTFRHELSAGYSGTRHAAGLLLSHVLGRNLVARVGYGASRSRTAAPELAHVEHGPLVGVYLPLGRDVRLSLDGRWHWREYEPVADRSDVQLDGFGALEVDLATRWTARAELSAIQVRSSVPAQSYRTLMGALSVQYAASLL